MMKKRIEVDSVLFSWFVPFCADILNQFRVGSDRRTAYEKITEHKCKSVIVGFSESVDSILETKRATPTRRTRACCKAFSSATPGAARSALSGQEMAFISAERLAAELRQMFMILIARTTSPSCTTIMS